MSIIAAGTTSGTALVSTGDTNGTLVIQTNGTTVAATFGTDQSLTLVGALSAPSIAGNAVATQAQQETGTSTTVLVTPGRQQFHQSAAKAWIQCNQNGAIAGSYNVASIADTGPGVVTATLTTAFSSTNYAVLGSGNGGGGGLFIAAGITSASVFTLLSFNTVSQSPQDSAIYLGVAFGDQ